MFTKRLLAVVLALLVIGCSAGVVWAEGNIPEPKTLTPTNPQP
ncbi:MAG TPA: hypothetical protein VNT75_23640 [Symbiobacteriaceae bacterium]|nr:hypothetical protein [Symbiobacteriaceae bacterium]